MQVLLLGPVTVVGDGGARVLGSTRQAALLARLALRAGRPVARADLVDAVFGDAPPATARNTLQVHASALRRLLGPGVLVAAGDGYQYRGPPAAVDALRFSTLVDDGVAASRAQRHVEAARQLRAAEALWRGRPLEGIDSPALLLDRERLLALRQAATLARVDADLALGRHLLLVTELEGLAAEHPLDEGVARRLMVALHRSGRSAEALAVFDRVRRRLRSELGTDPGSELRRTHERVLAQDPALERADVLALEHPHPGWPPLLPSAGTLVGRDALLADLEAGLGGARLHTLVGPSGVGKTRLATELAARRQDRWPAGAMVVDGVGLGDPADVVRQVAELLGDGRPTTLGPEEQRRVVDAAEGLVVLDDLPPGPATAGWLADLVGSSRATWVVTAHRPVGVAGERIVQVPPLAAREADGTPGPAAVLLLARARSVGAALPDDEATRQAAARCAELLDGNPLALELAARLAVPGLPELRRTLERRLTAGRPDDAVTVSFDRSLALLTTEELGLLDVLTLAGGPLDGETLASLGSERALADLVRDGLVSSTTGAHGDALFSVRPLLAAHRAATRDPRLTHDAGVRLVRALVAAVGEVRHWLPMQLDSPVRARRLVALQPALDAVPPLARDLGLAAEVVPLALVLCELHFGRHGLARPVGRDGWLLDHPDVAAPRRVDLLLAEAVDHVNQSRTVRSRELLEEALRAARALGDDVRTALALAQRSVSQILLGVDLGVRDEQRREAVRLAEASGDPAVVAGTLLLLYPEPDAPPDLADVLGRAVRAARDARHDGLLALALANLAAVCLDTGRPEEAAVHAREGAAIAQRLHHRGTLQANASIAEAAGALLGTDDGLAHLADYLAMSWDDQSRSASADALLWMAVGLRRRRGDEAAGRCLGLYRAILVRFGASSTAPEEALVGRWLDGVTAVPPHEDLDVAIATLVAEWRPAVGGPTSRSSRSSRAP